MKKISTFWGILIVLAVLAVRVDAQSFLTNGLLAYYPFNGNANDASGTSNNITVNGATFTTNRFGQTNSAIFFSNNAIADSASFYPPLGSMSRTFSFWFKITNNSDQEDFLSYGGNNSADRFELKISSGGNLQLDSGYGTLTTAKSGYNDGNWHQFIVDMPQNGSYANISVYADGVLQSVSYDDFVTINTDGTYPLYVGSLFSGGRNLVGWLDDIRIYNRDLSTNEVAQLYAYEAQIPPVPTIITQPVSQTVDEGSQAGFAVVATGTNMFFQWQFNTTNILGATNASYSLASVTTNNAGNYTVVVSNAGGSVTSSNAVLTVIPAPRVGAATAVLVGPFVVSVSITDGGSGYTNAPVVRFIGGGGSGAEGLVTISNGTIISITMTNAGYGYTSAPLVIIEPPYILNPTLGIAPMTFLSFTNLTVGGSYQLQQFLSWYWVNQPAAFTATSSVYTQMIAGFGGIYRLALSPLPTQAFATALLYNDFVV